MTGRRYPSAIHYPERVPCPACAEHVPPCFLCHGARSVTFERAVVYEHVDWTKLDEPGHDVDVPPLERLDDDSLDQE